VISNFCTTAQGELPNQQGDMTNHLLSPFINPKHLPFALPTAENKYTTQIGSIDVLGLTKDIKPEDSNINRNRYGDPVETIDANKDGVDGIVNISELPGTTYNQPWITCTTDPAVCTVKLDGRVIHVINGSLTIDREIVILPGNTGKSGAGTFIIDNPYLLNIKANIKYCSDATTPKCNSTISDRRQLPSVAFLDMQSNGLENGIVISEGVESIVGTYYAQGIIRVNGFTGGSDVQLNVSGLMIAGSFIFKRNYQGASGVQAPSEIVTYDGRLQTNTPPGLSTLSTALVNLTESLP
jgi:hypothetical protein